MGRRMHAVSADGNAARRTTAFPNRAAFSGNIHAPRCDARRVGRTRFPAPGHVVA